MISATTPGSEVEGVTFLCEDIEACERVLTPEAVDFVAGLHRRFNARRVELLRRRDQRQTSPRERAWPSAPPSRAPAPPSASTSR